MELVSSCLKHGGVGMRLRGNEYRQEGTLLIFTTSSDNW